MAHKPYGHTSIPMEDEQKLEQEALAKIDPEAIKAEIISDMGFDEVDDAEKIEKAVAREVKTRTFAAKAIGSKIKARDEKVALEKELENLKKTPKDNNVDPDELDKKLDAKLNERLENRDLESLGYPPELKAEIKKVAQVLGVSVLQAKQDPYIQSKIEAYDNERKNEEATATRTNKSSGKVSHSMDKVPNVDWKDPKSVKAYEEWKEEMRKQHPLTEL